MALPEGMIYERDADKRGPFTLGSLNSIDRSTATLAMKMVQIVKRGCLKRATREFWGLLVQLAHLHKIDTLGFLLLGWVSRFSYFLGVNIWIAAQHHRSRFMLHWLHSSRSSTKGGVSCSVLIISTSLTEDR